MLFKALIERLLGSDEAQDWKERERERSKTSRFSYSNYPSLVGILFDLLDPNGPLKSGGESDNNSPPDVHGAEGVFPALQILRQAPPPEANRGAILESVICLLESPHWHLRDMAGRTVASLIRPEEYSVRFYSLLTTTPNQYNARHGYTLAAKYILRRWLQTSHSIRHGQLSVKSLASQLRFIFRKSLTDAI